MIKYYEVVEVFNINRKKYDESIISNNGIEIELTHYRGYNLESAEYCFTHNNGNLELREFEFEQEYEIDFENEEYQNALLNGGMKCGYEILKRKEEK